MTSLLEKFVERYGRLPTEVDPDYLEMLKMSKYHVVERPFGSPGKCIGCGSTKIDGRRYVDLGAQIDWYGGVYLCGHCVKEAATNLGLFNEDKQLILELQEIINSKKNNNEEAIRLQEVMLRTAEEIKSFYGDIFVDRQPDSSNNSTESDSVTSEESSGSDENSGSNNEIEQPTTGTKSGTTKSSSSTGRENVPSLAELLNPGSN